MRNPYLPLCVLMYFVSACPSQGGEEVDNPWDEFAVFMADDNEAPNDNGGTPRVGKPSLDWPPLPIAVCGVKSPIQSLNGQWQFRAGLPRDFDGAKGLESGEWTSVEVPGDFRMQGHDGGRVAYTRLFEVPADWKGGRVMLRCHEIAAAAEIWMNGRKVGSHVGHFIPFALDVTDQVRCGEANRIVIVAYKYALGRDMSGYAVHVGGGITRKIELICLPPAHVVQLHVTTDFDDRYEDATLHVTTEIANTCGHALENADLEFSLVDSDAKPAIITPESASISLVQPGKRMRLRSAIRVGRPSSWNAEQPRLYRLTATLRADGQELQQIERRIGFREIEVRGKELLVNGRPVKLRGANRHLAHPLRGRSLTPELARQDAELLKAANCNFVRTSHYPPSEEFIAACDELGLYVEEEAPFCFFNDRKSGITQADVTRYAVYANLKMVQRDLSHASVVIWSIGNESKWGSHFQAAAQAVARTDPSRPRTFMWFNRQAESLTVAAEHYPGPDGVTRVERDRPTLFSEYCHLPAYVPHEMYTDPGIDDQWGELLAKTWENLRETPGALGGAIWCGIDDVFHVPPVDNDGSCAVRGVAAWGLLDGWRRPKPEYWHTKKIYSPVRVMVSSLDVPRQGEPLRIPVANRYDFTNLNDLKIRWLCGGASGIATADVPPQNEGEIVVDSANLTPGDTFWLRFLDHANRVVDEYVLPVASEEKATQGKAPPATWTLEQSSDVFTVRSQHAVVQIDHGTGMIIEGTVDDQRVVEGGPHLAFVPTFSKHQQRAMKNEAPRLTPVYGTQWQADRVTAEKTGGSISIQFSGRYKEANLEGTYEFRPSGEMIFRYRLKLNRNILQQDDVVEAATPGGEASRRALFAFSGFQDRHTALVRGKKPNEKPVATSAESLAAVPRQLGIRFELPQSVDTLAWERKAQWNVYPQDHIGRPRGQTQAFLLDRDTQEVLGQRPDWTWSQSACPLGTRDFRSTKHNIHRASLTDSSGYGLEIVSDGTQHSRCYIHDDSVHWLIAELDNGPSETFMSNYFDPRRESVPLDETFSGTVHLRFVSPVY